MPGESKGNSRRIQFKDCFVCGSENPSGLNIPFFYDGKTIRAEYSPGAELCGFDGIVHGGVIYSLADEAMMHLIWASALRATSAEVTIRYHNYAIVNEILRVTAEFENVAPRLIRARCRIVNKENKKVATAVGKFLPFAGGNEDTFKKR